MSIDSSYNKPDVTVIQQIENPSIANADPDLYACIVGMAYLIVRDSSAGTYDGTSALYTYPEVLASSTVEASTVVVQSVKGGHTDTLAASQYTAGSTGVTLNDDIYVERLLSNASGATGSATSGSAVLTDASASFITWGTEAGDIVTISSGSDIGDHTILTIDSETAVTLTASLTTTQSNLDYYITEVDYIGNGLAATILITYRALREDLTTVGTVENTADASSQLGFLLPDNPLGYGVLKALQNTNSKVKYLAITADTAAQHTAASETLESHEVYSIAPLTLNTTNIGLWKTHVDLMSTESEKSERGVITCRDLALRSVTMSSTTATVANVTGYFYSVTRAGAQFLTNSVVNGDMFHTSVVDENDSLTGVSSYMVRSIVSEDQIQVYSLTDISGSVAAFSITSQEFTKLQRSQHIRDYASSIEDKRVINVWPPQTQVSPEGTSEDVPGYHIAAALAGATAALPAQQGFTKLKLAGFDSLSYSNLGYFTEAQLDVMASGGNMIFVQPTSSSMIECRHQLTTNMSALKYREYSIVKNVDYIAKLVRARFRPFVGRWNITNFFMQMLKVAMQGTFEELKISNDIAGPNIISGAIITLEQNATNSDQVDIIVDLVIPYPANNIRITLRI